MKKKSIRGLASLLLFSFLAVCYSGCDNRSGEEKAAPFLTGWKKYAAADLGRDGFGDAIYRTDIGYLCIEDNKVILSDTPQSERKLTLGTESGYIQGDNRGEFGGQLNYYDEDDSGYTIAEPCHPRALFSCGGEIYMLHGLAHLSASYGCISRIVMQDGRWCLVDTVSLGATPQAYFADEAAKEIYVATNSSVVRVDIAQKDIKTDVLSELPYVSRLSADAIVKYGEYVYVSMRHAVVTVNINTAETFYYIDKIGTSTQA